MNARVDFYAKRQSTAAGYDHFTREALDAGNRVKQNSIDLRSTLDSVYVNGIKDLRCQAMAVDVALAEKIHMTEEICQELEAELVRVRNYENNEQKFRII